MLQPASPTGLARPLRFLTAFVSTCVLALPASAALPGAVGVQLRAAAIPAEAMGVVVQRVRDGATIVSHGARKSMQPASTMKLITALVGLEKLGPAYRGRSELRTRAQIVDGVMQGDLALVGLGDFDLDWQAFERMLQLLRQQGVREIRGDLVLDRSFFEPSRVDAGAAPFDESAEFRYNVIPDALLLNTNLVKLDMASGGSNVRVDITPILEGVSVVSDFALVERECSRWEDGWIVPEVEASEGAIRISLRGDFPMHCTAATEINVLDRVAFADRMFRSSWKRLGGTFTGVTRDGDAGAEARVLAQHHSRTLAEIARDINKQSDNPIARVLYLTLGALSESGASLPTAQRAEREVRDWLVRHGIGHEGLVLENGSGLSRTERVRPVQLAAVLRAASASAWAPEFLASLPIVGVDGAMANRLNTSPAAGHARIKTGTLRDVSAIAGYVSDRRGERYVVVAMVNHERATGQAARPILDALIDWVARRPASPPMRTSSGRARPP